MPEIARNDCGERIPSPGGFSWTDRDLAIAADEARSRVEQGDPKAPNYVEDVIALIAHKSDTDCKGTLSKNDIEQFKAGAPNQTSIDFADHLLENFDKIASLAKEDWSEIKEPSARALVEKYFKDNQPDNVISRADLATMKKSSPFGMSFAAAFDYEPERHKALAKAGILGLIFGSKDLDAYNELAKQVNLRVELRQQILKNSLPKSE